MNLVEPVFFCVLQVLLSSNKGALFFGYFVLCGVVRAGQPLRAKKVTG
jgi:hypothetical protein